MDKKSYRPTDAKSELAGLTLELAIYLMLNLGAACVLLYFYRSSL